MDRNSSQINAGSMADIAFLLLIFFLVTTTMEVDAGIQRNLPLKQEIITVPPLNKRDVLDIQVNSKNELMVEDQFIELNELEEVCRSFYTANSQGAETDITLPAYTLITENQCIEEIMSRQRIVDQNPYDRFAKKELEKWQLRMDICSLHGGAYNEISKRAVVRLKNSAGTTYGTYIGIQNTLKKVVVQLRQERCQALGWGNYFDLNEGVAAEKKKIRMLRLLVPERIVESKIEK